MANPLFLKYVNFLKEHQLYNHYLSKYLWKHSIHIDYDCLTDNILIGCSTVLDNKKRLLYVFPCYSYLNNDCAVAINIYVYVTSLFFFQNIGKEYEEDFYARTLALFYQKLYILENENEALLEFEKKIEHNLLKDGSLRNKLLLDNRDKMIDNYYLDRTKIDKDARKIKRLTKNFVYSKRI